MKTITLADWKVSRLQKKLIKQVLKSGRLTYGPMTRELEKRFAELHGRKHALLTSSGTAGLKISLGALKERHGWPDGAEVIIPAVTFVATMNAVLMNNLKPVLVDVDEENVNMDPTLLEKVITKRTVAIIPVHLLGQPVNMRPIMNIAKKHNLRVVEDSCETMFVTKDGESVGSHGDTACFSSYLAHLMVTGVGGFILTDDDELAIAMRSMMFHGRDEAYLTIDDNNKTGIDFNEMVKKRFHFPRFGYSDRVTELEAALGLGDLDTWDYMIYRRQENAIYLVQGLLDIPDIWFPVEHFREHAFMFFPMFCNNRDGLVNHLEANNIHTRHMMPLTTQPLVKKYFKGNLAKKYPVADYVNKHGLLIGCHQYLNTRDLDYVIKTIKEFYE